MKSTFFAIPFLILTFLTSCNNVQKTSDSLQTIDIVTSMNDFKQINLSQFANNIDYIPFESQKEALLGDIFELDFSENQIITTNGDAIMLYDLSGKLIRKFGTKGRGPEEYEGIRHLSFSGNNKILFNSNTDLIEYNINGSFSKKIANCLLIDQKYPLLNWHLVNDSLLLGHIDNVTGQEEYKALLVNMNGEIIKKYKNYDILESKGARIFNGFPKFSEFQNSIFFKEQFIDTLFSFNEEYELIPKYNFKLGNLGVTEAVRTKFPPIIKDYLYISNIFQTENFLFLDVNIADKNPSRVLGIFNKKTNDLVFCQTPVVDNDAPENGIFNDIDAGPNFFPKYMADDNTLISIITAKQLKDHVACDYFKSSVPKFPEKKKQLEALANRLNEFDNPVLMLVHFGK